MVFTCVYDRNKRQILSVRDQNVFNPVLRKKRLMTIIHIFIINRYQCDTVHYLTPTRDNALQCASMQTMGLYSKYSNEVGMIIVAQIATKKMRDFVQGDNTISPLIRNEQVKQLVEV